MTYSDSLNIIYFEQKIGNFSISAVYLLEIAENTLSERGIHLILFHFIPVSGHPICRAHSSIAR